MATFFVTHHKYPTNPKLFTVNIEQVIKRKGEPNTQFFYSNDGEEFWELYIAADAVDAYGDSVPPFWADVLTTEQSLDELVAGKVDDLCALIDWTAEGNLEAGLDRYKPVLVSASPVPGADDVPIASTIKVVLKELLPGSGMDIGTLSFKVKGVPVAPKVTGHPYEYTFEFSPKPVY